MELADRFGPPPEPVRHLIGLARLRQRCRGLGVARLEAGPKGIAVQFRDPGAARRQLSSFEGRAPDLAWRDDRLVCTRPTATPDQRLEAVSELLTRLERSSR
ncbi:MAG: mfd [Geminicoccaceae bacterium]|nr:mfd [Geminicoccaceae bacterium]